MARGARGLDPEPFLLTEGAELLTQRRCFALERGAAGFDLADHLGIGAERLHRARRPPAQGGNFRGGRAAQLLELELALPARVVLEEPQSRRDTENRRNDKNRVRSRPRHCGLEDLNPTPDLCCFRHHSNPNFRNLNFAPQSSSLPALAALKPRPANHKSQIQDPSARRPARRYSLFAPRVHDFGPITLAIVSPALPRP